MATDAQTLLSSANCYECVSPGQWQLLKLALLQQISLALNPMAATDPASLLAQANCYNCVSPGMWQLMELALLAQISTNGAGGGGSGTGATFGNYGGGVPSFTPSGGVGLAVDTSTGTLWEYYNGAWH